MNETPHRDARRIKRNRRNGGKTKRKKKKRSVKIHKVLLFFFGTYRHEIKFYKDKTRDSEKGKKK